MIANAVRRTDPCTLMLDRVTRRKEYQVLFSPRDSERESLLDRDYVIELFGSRSGFVRFHKANDGGEHHLDIPTERRHAFKLTEPEALDVAEDVLGAGRIGSLKAEPKPMRDDDICQLRAAGLSARQIMRITGISLGVISRAFSRELD